MAFTCYALFPAILHGTARVANQRHHATEEQVNFIELSQAIESSCAHQTIIGMVEYGLYAHEIQHFIKPFGSKSLKRGIRVSRAAHAIHHVKTIVEFQNHIVDL